MSIREWMNRHSSVTTLVAVVVLVVALGFVYLKTMGTRSGQVGGGAYYYDLGNGKLFVASATQISPVAAPSGKIEVRGKQQDAGVLAYVFKCGGCMPDESLADMTKEQVEQKGARIAYLGKYTAEARKRMTAPKDDAHPVPMMVRGDGGEMMAKVPSKPGTYPKFVIQMSPQGAGILRAGYKQCPDGTLPKPCLPPQ